MMEVKFPMPKDEWFKTLLVKGLRATQKNPEKLTPQHVISPSYSTSNIK